jgi:thrombospondin type 3 repeat protein
MSRRLLLSTALAAISLVLAGFPAGVGAAVLGVHPDPGAHSATPPLHPPALFPSLESGARIASLARISSTPVPLPTIRRVTPMKLMIGAKLTIIGRNFIRGRHRDTVVFLRAGAPAVFLKADTATRTKIVITLTSKLTRFLRVSNTGAKVATRFRLRVLAHRFGARFTPTARSPLVLPEPITTTNPNGPSAPGCTLQSAAANPSADTDGDGLSNGLELQIKTDPCNADTDGDGITDGYEYQSALDLNSRALPYPGKRPYPNALDPTDANTDYDGDGLTMADEYAAWVTYGHKAFPLNYSDGTQTTGGPVAVTPATQWEDMNHDGFLTDDEKDIDGDGLTNWDEAHGRMTPGWWKAVFTSEVPYTVPYQGTNWLDADTDGDGLIDGLDDVDHDGWTNAQEVAGRFPIAPATGYWTQPFNPCLPDPTAITCAKHPPVDDSYPPFAAGQMQQGEAIPLVWPRP